MIIKKRITFGIIVVMLGIFLLMESMGILLPDVHHIILSWQSLLIIVGVILSANRKPTSGFILILIGICFLLPDIFKNFVSTTDWIIPITLIVAGTGLIIHAITRKNCRFCKCSNKKAFMEIGIKDWILKSSEEGNIYRDYVFSHSKEKWTYSKLKNIEIVAVFSDIELDFTQVKLSEDNELHIKVNSVFSSVTLYVPTDWNIMLQQNGVFSGFLDKRPKNEIDLSNKKTVFLRIGTVFSGGEIKCCV